MSNETVSMCKAINDIRAEGCAIGYEEGRKEELFRLLSELVADGILPFEEAAKRAGVSIAEFQSMTA